MAVINFQASEVAPDMGFQDPIPEGWYNASMFESALAPNKNGNGAVLTCKFKVIDGYYKSNVVTARLNIRNTNEIAQRIGLGQLSAICHSVNVLNCVDSNMLHNIPLKLKVSILFQDGYSPSNNIVAYRSAQEDVPVNLERIDITELLESHKQEKPAQPAGMPVMNPMAAMPPLAPVMPSVTVPVNQAPVMPPLAPAILGGAPAQPWGGQPVTQPVIPPAAPVTNNGELTPELIAHMQAQIDAQKAQQPVAAPVMPAPTMPPVAAPAPVQSGEVVVPDWMKTAGTPTV